MLLEGDMHDPVAGSRPRMRSVESNLAVDVHNSRRGLPTSHALR